jgi:hypothetical protein
MAFGKADSREKAAAWLRENVSQLEAISVPELALEPAPEPAPISEPRPMLNGHDRGAATGRDRDGAPAKPTAPKADGKVRDNETRAKWYEQMFNDLGRKKIIPNDYAVGVAIGRHVTKEDNGDVFPGIATLAKLTGLSLNTARTSIDRLLAAGHLRVKRSKPLLMEPLLKPPNFAL